MKTLDIVLFFLLGLALAETLGQCHASRRPFDTGALGAGARPTAVYEGALAGLAVGF